MWSDTDQKYAAARIIFTDTERSNWTWDEEAGAFYWHRFFSHQPDLNYDTPDVQQAVLNVVSFWLDLGIDGFRVDAVPYLFQREGTNCENLPETHAFLVKLRKFVDEHYPNSLLLAEANQWPEDVVHYFGEGNEFHMAYHFPIMPRLFMTLPQEDRRPIVEILERTPAIPEGCQWGMSLRNHDELTLEMVTDEERDYLYVDPVYGYQAVNVEAQQRYSTSLLNWVREMIHLRKGHPVFGRGALTFIKPQNRKVFAFVRPISRRPCFVFSTYRSLRSRSSWT